MIISTALTGVRRLYVDTPPLIYYVEENPTYIARMDSVIEWVKTTPIQGVCSVITLTEVLPVPLRTAHATLVNDYRDILLNSREFICLSVSQSTAEFAADLRAPLHSENTGRAASGNSHYIRMYSVFDQ